MPCSAVCIVHTVLRAEEGSGALNTLAERERESESVCVCVGEWEDDLPVVLKECHTLHTVLRAEEGRSALDTVEVGPEAVVVQVLPNTPHMSNYSLWQTSKKSQGKFNKDTIK